MPQDAVEIKRRIGLVPDESLLFDRLTGAEFWSSWGACTAGRSVARAAPASF